MKASIKFREDQKPLFRAKVPLSIFGLPFQSGIVAGDSKELSLNLSTFFESGPSLKVGYRPNDSWNPFSLVVKTGTGPFGSPVSSSLVMSAEFNLVGRVNPNPTFMLHFKPSFGDFCVKKSQSSPSSVSERKASCAVSSDDDASIEVVETPDANGGSGVFNMKKVAILPQSTGSAIAGVISGVEVAATTRLPVRSRAVVNFRWGVRVPAEIRSCGNSTSGINLSKIPFLVMNKIGFEHVDGDDSKPKPTAVQAKLGLEKADMTEACLNVKRQLEMLQTENGLLKKAVEDLRQDISAGKLASPPGDFNSGMYREMERNGVRNLNGGNQSQKRNSEKKSSMEGDEVKS